MLAGIFSGTNDFTCAVLLKFVSQAQYQPDVGVGFMNIIIQSKEV